MASKFRKKPIEIEAVRYTGDNHDEVYAFTGGNFQEVDEEDRTEDPEITAQVFDKLHSTWVGVKDGQWVLKGVRGEFYPCDESVMAETYDRADSVYLARNDDVERIEKVAEAIRQTREYQAGMAFGVPEDAREQFLGAIAYAASRALA